MNGARMRSYSLSGTPPEKISRSVPRLSALATARTRTSPVGWRRDRLGADFRLAGATYQSACAEAVIPDWTLNPPPAISRPAPKSTQCPNAPLTSPPRGRPTP